MSSASSASESQPSSFVEQAYARIRTGILHGDYAFGTPLPARGLAGRLGMSFLPVLKALERLQREGLVESSPRVSTRVVVPGLDRLRGLYDLREACEAQAARLAAERATAAERRALVQLARRVDRAYEALHEGTTRTARLRTNLLHASLHARIADMARSPQLLQAMERRQALIFRVLLDLPPRPLDPMDDRHEPLSEAIANGDADIAEEAMRRHIRASARRVLALAVPSAQLPGHQGNGREGREARGSSQAPRAKPSRRRAKA